METFKRRGTWEMFSHVFCDSMKTRFFLSVKDNGAAHPSYIISIPNKKKPRSYRSKQTTVKTHAM